MGNMKVWTLLVLAIWVCWLSILVVSARGRPLIAEEENTLLGITVIDFTTANATNATYRYLIGDLRDQLTDSAVPGPYGIPVTRHSVMEDSEEHYGLVRLNKKVIIIIDVVDVRVLGYRDIYNDTIRNHLFKVVSCTAKVTIYENGGGLPLRIPFGGSYEELEKQAGDRREIDLGITKLGDAVQSVAGLALEAEDRNELQATFLIIAIQMVVEATRFKHIEEKVLSSINGTGDYGSFKPDTCTTNLEDYCEQLSEAALNGTEDQFKEKIQQLTSPADGNNLITEYMGILKYSGAAKAEDYVSFLKLYDIVSTD